MNTKLTLSIDENVIASAKKYSQKKGVSLSSLVEEYLMAISRPSKRTKKHSILELRGSLGKVPKDFDYDEAKWEYFKEKYKL